MCGDVNGNSSQVISFDGQKFEVKGNLRNPPFDATAFIMKGAQHKFYLSLNSFKSKAAMVYRLLQL